MNICHKNAILMIVFTFYLVTPNQCEFFSGSFASAFGATLYGSWMGLRCNFYECCEDPWVILDDKKLHTLYNNKLHGQHLVKEISWKHLQTHWKKENPSKPLVLSFHGWTGTGKNFVSKLIAESMFKKGMSSDFIKLFVCSYEFPLNNEESVNKYKLKILNKVEKLVSQCPYALIIFDEVDKAPFGILDVIKPLVDYHDSVGGVDYRKATFIFLSNTGGSTISENVYDFWKLGQREEITLKDLENLIMIGAYNEKGGMKGMDMIDKNLVSAFIPFLPLERKHVKSCIADEISSRKLYASDELINKIADQLEYFPEDTKAFSKTGCKRVSEKVDLLTSDEF